MFVGRAYCLILYNNNFYLTVICYQYTGREIRLIKEERKQVKRVCEWERGGNDTRRQEKRERIKQK